MTRRGPCVLGSLPRPPHLRQVVGPVAAGGLKGDFLVERASAIGRLDIVILVITVAAIATAMVLNDREAARLLREREAPAKLRPWMRAIRAARAWHRERFQGDPRGRDPAGPRGFRAILARSGPGSGLARGFGDGRWRFVEMFMIAWHAYLISEGHYWLNPKLKYLIVFGTVAQFQYRTTGAILGTWAVLALSTRWRSRPDPLDRLGCFLGYCWIAHGTRTHRAGVWMP